MEPPRKKKPPPTSTLEVALDDYDDDPFGLNIFDSDDAAFAPRGLVRPLRQRGKKIEMDAQYVHGNFWKATCASFNC